MLVQNKGNYAYSANGVTLNPGVNEVDEKEFEKFLKHPLMSGLDKDGEFEYKKDEKKLNANDLIALISDTHDLAVLEKMKDGEKRTTVLDAINKRIEELQNPAQ